MVIPKGASDVTLFRKVKLSVLEECDTMKNVANDFINLCVRLELKRSKELT